MSEGHDEPIRGCSLDCALVNGCAMGGMRCEVCGKYFCSIELDSSRVCVECREKLEAEDE